MQKHQDSLSGRVGGASLLPLAGAEIRVVNKASGLPASLYSDNGITPLAQPVVTDPDGNYAFYAADGKYTLTFSGARFSTFTREIILEDPADNPYASLAQLSAPTGTTLINHEGTPLNTFLNAITGGGSAAVTSVNSVTPVAGNVALTADNVPEAGTPTNRYFTSARVRAAVLDGLSTASSAAIAATDTVLDAFGKLQAQVSSMLAAKDASGGYAGLTGFAVNLKNAAGSVVSTLASSATVARTWTFPDKSGTVAMTSDIQAGGSMILLGSVVVSSPLTSIDFLNVFTSSYDNYVIEFNNIKHDAASSTTPTFRLAVAGAASLSGYYAPPSYPTTNTLTGGSNVAICSAYGPSEAMVTTVRIRAANGSGNKAIGFSGHKGGGSAFVQALGEGVFVSASSATGFQLFFGASNVISGSVFVYGIKNS